jgi:TonB family protein
MVDQSSPSPVVTERVEPEYPEGYRRARISGIVILELAISETGETENFAVLKSLGPAIDVAAIDAVKKWKFAPATRDGKPIPVLFNLTINFKLK